MILEKLVKCEHEIGILINENKRRYLLLSKPFIFLVTRLLNDNCGRGMMYLPLRNSDVLSFYLLVAYAWGKVKSI